MFAVSGTTTTIVATYQDHQSKLFIFHFNMSYRCVTTERGFAHVYFKMANYRVGH